MDKNSAVKLLVDTNREVMNIPDGEHGFHIAKTGNSRMQAPPLIAPNKETQDKVLDYTINAMQSIKELKYRAATAYYMINLLHLFRDGNGRTARVTFEKLGGFSNNNSFSEKGVSAKFEDSYELVSAKKFDELAMYALLSEINSKNDKLYTTLQKRQKSILSDKNSIMSSVFALAVIGGAFNYKTIQQALEGYDEYGRLGDEDKTRACYAFIDHNTGPVTISGLAMLQLYTEKDERDLFLSRVARGDGEWIIDIDNGECVAWSAKDFLRYAEIAENLRERLLMLEVDIFAKPNNYKIDNYTIAEIATNSGLLEQIH